MCVWFIKDKAIFYIFLIVNKSHVQSQTNNGLILLTSVRVTKAWYIFYSSDFCRLLLLYKNYLKTCQCATLLLSGVFYKEITMTTDFRVKEHVIQCSWVAHWCVFNSLLDNNRGLQHKGIRYIRFWIHNHNTCCSEHEIYWLYEKYRKTAFNCIQTVCATNYEKIIEIKEK